MSWLPDIPHLIRLLRRTEEGENPLQDATELFWLFCKKSLSPDEFRDRVLYWIDKHLQDSSQGRGFFDLDVRGIILQGPEKAEEVAVGRLDTLCEMKRVPYIPDEIDDSESLYISTMLEASRLTRLLKTDGYSDKTREVLAHALNALARFKKSEITHQNPLWQKEYSAFSDAVGSFLCITQFLIEKSDGRYEDSLKSLANGIAYYIMADSPSFSGTTTGITEPTLIEFRKYVADHLQELPWIRTLEPETAVECFEAVRNRGRVLDPKNIASVCELLALTYRTWWPLEEDENEVKDAEGNEWVVSDYWYHASGWVEAQLQPSEMRELLEDREDQAAERRLRIYFFSDEQWTALPERAKRSLVSADRAWFGGTDTRTEAILNELKIAAEELILHGLWRPLEQWVKHSSDECAESKEFLTLEGELSAKGWQPDMSHFERVCGMTIVRLFLQKKGVASSEQEWFAQDLPSSLSRLRLVRNRAEHVSSNRWARKGVHQFVTEFMGIGQPGVLPQLARILFSSG